MTYQEVNPTNWKPEKDGDFIEGYFVQKQEGIGENESKLYSIQTPAGVKNVWGAAILDSRMALVRLGSKIKITFQGLAEKTDKGKNPAKLFKVEVDNDDNLYEKQTVKQA